jgi:hypothetical protein
MANSYHLKEINGFETVQPASKPLENRRKDRLSTEKFPAGRKFLNEMMLWETALQIDTWGQTASNQR